MDKMTTYEVPTQQSSRQNTLPSEEYVVKVMPPILGTLDMTTTFLIIIFFITNATTAVAGGAAAFTYWTLGAVTFFIPCVIATAQLGVMFPHEGSLYNWTHKAFGGYWSFFVAFCAWFPGVLVIISADDLFIAYIQGLNSNWLTQPWQQGLVIILLIALSGFLALQRFRTVQNVLNMVIGLTFLGVFLIGLAGIVWLAEGHASATSFSHLSDWSINWSPTQGNLSLFGLITLAYLGVEAPLNMGGEIVGRKVVTRHLLWGTLLVLVGYFIATFSVLVVQGSTNGAVPFALVSTVDMVLGKIAGSITAVCLMSCFVMAAVTYNYAYARLLLTASIDKRLPVSVGRLSKHRIPANAIIFQTIVAAVAAAIVFFVVPYVANLGKNPADLSTEVYDVLLAGATLVWATSTLFLFVNIARFYFHDRLSFLKQAIFPLPVLAISIVLGSVSCLLAIVGTLFYSWTSLISNNQWWFIIGGLTLVCLIIAAIGSMFATSEAAWEDMSMQRH
jgi:amino acid transporter